MRMAVNVRRRGLERSRQRGILFNSASFCAIYNQCGFGLEAGIDTLALSPTRSLPICNFL